MKFRLVQINRLKYKNGWNLMFGKTFIRSFHWSREKEAFIYLEKMNATLKDIDTLPYTKELIVAKYPHWVKPPKDNYCG